MLKGKRELGFKPRRYMSTLASALLSHFSPDQGLRGAEIGVAGGLTSSLLLQTFPSLFLYMIDSYRDRALHRDMGLCLKEARDNTTKVEDRRIILVCDSEVARRLIPKNALDFVFIDAMHSYEGCKKDLELWVPCVRKGGLLTGHDYGSRKDRLGKWGVKEAVDEFLSQFSSKAVVLEHYIWYAKKSW